MLVKRVVFGGRIVKRGLLAFPFSQEVQLNFVLQVLIAYNKAACIPEHEPERNDHERLLK